MSNVNNRLIWVVLLIVLLLLGWCLISCASGRDIPEEVTCADLGNFEPETGEANVGYVHALRLCSDEALAENVSFTPCGEAGLTGMSIPITEYWSDEEIPDSAEPAAPTANPQATGAPAPDESRVQTGLRPEAMLPADVEFTVLPPPTRRPAQPEDDPELLYHLHQMVRFHPVDTFEAARNGYPPEHNVETEAPIYILDMGDHLDFTSSVVAGSLKDTSARPQAREVVKTIPTDEILVIEEAVILAALSALRTELQAFGETFVTPDEVPTTYVVLPFGTYNCGEAPGDLLGEMIAFPEFTHFVVSAGNDETSQPSFPAAFTSQSFTPNDSTGLHERVTSVGSVTDDGSVRSCFSNFNPTGASTVPWIDTWRVGEEVNGSIKSSSGIPTPGTWSGTSFAAPQEAALLAGAVEPSATEPTPTPVPTPGALASRETEVEIEFPAGSGTVVAVPTITYCDVDSGFAIDSQSVIDE